MSLGPIMLDIEGVALTPADRDLLVEPAVGGVILFSRNYASPTQVIDLVADIRALRSPPLIVAVDHEGGRVQRFREGFTRVPPMRTIGELWRRDRDAAIGLARRTGWLIAAELRAVGIDLAFAPCVDLDWGVSDIIGDRAFGRRPEQVARSGIAFVPQGREIFADLTVEENLLLGAMGRGGLGAAVPEEIYGRFPILKERRSQRGGTLSGGQQQQLAIGRALAGRPRLLLLDEPSEGLQPSIVIEVAEALKREAAEQGLTLITVEQNVDLALRVAERCLFIENGTLVAEAASADLRRDAALIHKHLAI